MRHRCRCAVNRLTRIRLFPLFFHNVCSQSSRFPSAGQRERNTGNEIGAPLNVLFVANSQIFLSLFKLSALIWGMVCYHSSLPYCGFLHLSFFISYGTPLEFIKSWIRGRVWSWYIGLKSRIKLFHGLAIIFSFPTSASGNN